VAVDIWVIETKPAVFVDLDRFLHFLGFVIYC
jgi:hypothetical protein